MIPLAVALALRRWLAAAAAGVVLALFASFVLPRAISSAEDAPAAGERVRAMTANLEVGRANRTELVRLVRRERIDLLAVQELTPGAVRRLRRAGLERWFPHRVLAAAPRSTGGGIYSRYPLRRLPKVPATFEMPRAVMRAPRAAPVELVSVHPNPPVDGSATRAWRDDLDALPRADPDGAIRVLPGDFNATLDHDELRELVDSGYVDAADAEGKGLIPTWPSGRRIPPPVTIDHVLVDRRVGIANVVIHSLAGTDHRPVSAELVVPSRR